MLKLFFWFVRNREGSMRQHVGLATLIAFTGVVELFALGALALFVASLSSPDQVMGSKGVNILAKYVGSTLLTDPRIFFSVLGGTAVALIVFKNLLTAVHVYLTARLEGRMNVYYGSRMLDGILRLSYEATAARNTAKTIETIAWRVCVGTLVQGMMTVFGEAVVFLLLMVSLLTIEPVLTLASIAVLGSLGILTFTRFKGRVLHYGNLIKKYKIRINNSILIGIQGVREIKLFGKEAEIGRAYSAAQTGEARNRAISRVFERGTVWVVESVGFAALIAISLTMILSSDLSTPRTMGILSMLAVAAWRILPSIYRTVTVLGGVKAQMPYLLSVKALVEEIDLWRLEQDQIEETSLPPLRHDISFQNVGFRYANADSDALTGFTFEIHQGECIGLVGRSGAGKSTLADLLAGLLVPSTGAIAIDGRKLDASSTLSWQHQIGFVSQQPFFFDGTIAENVAFALHDHAVDYDKVLHCCERAGINEFLDRLPKGIHSPVGERGVFLSGGQAQRVAIARALYRDPKVLIFDEATSSLDDLTEQTIRKTIMALKGAITMVVIAHRLQAVQDCDRLVWLKDGSLFDAAPPEVILPRYAREGSPSTEQARLETLPNNPE